jgi:hypothetical protein
VRSDEDPSGRLRTLDRDNLISVTPAPPPEKYGVTHWSSRLLAHYLGIGYGTVARVWRDHRIQPWRAEAYAIVLPAAGTGTSGPACGNNTSPPRTTPLGVYADQPTSQPPPTSTFTLWRVKSCASGGR